MSDNVFCKDCKFCDQNTYDFVSYWKCLHPDATEYNLVSGESNQRYCTKERDIVDGRCGPYGDNFEKRTKNVSHKNMIKKQPKKSQKKTEKKAKKLIKQVKKKNK